MTVEDLLHVRVVRAGGDYEANRTDKEGDMAVRNALSSQLHSRTCTSTSRTEQKMYKQTA